MPAKKQKNKKSDSHPAIERAKKTSIGNYASDMITEWMGSWFFIGIFLVFLFGWMGVNIYAWASHWDPFPFILLNLVLSCMAALQAPIILMSQNRQSDRDRITAKYDYAVNRKAEREIQDIQKELQSIKRLLQKK
jgi:uncharacterized membrane protein